MMFAQPHQQNVRDASGLGEPVGPGGYDAHQQQSLSIPPTVERQSSFTGLPPVRRTSTLRIDVDLLMGDNKGRSHEDGKRQQPPLLDEVQQQGGRHFTTVETSFPHVEPLLTECSAKSIQ